METLKGNLRERVRDLREKNNWSQTDLAEYAGVSPSNISRIESGKIETVNHEILLAMAHTFSVSTDFLLGETDRPEPKQHDLITAEQLAEVVVNCFPSDGATPEMRSDLKKALIPFFKQPVGRTGR